MGKFSFYLDKRGKKDKPENYKFSLCVRANIKNDTIYMPITANKKRKEFVKLTEEQYKRVFVKKSLDIQSIDFRENCSTYITRCERVLSSLGENYTRKEFVQLYKSEGEIVEEQRFTSLVLKDVLKYYLENTTKDSAKYRGHMRTSVNVFNTFKSDLSITDITTDFLERLKKWKKEDKKSDATIQSYNRDIRNVNQLYKRYIENTTKGIPIPIW